MNTSCFVFKEVSTDGERSVVSIGKVTLLLTQSYTIWFPVAGHVIRTVAFIFPDSEFTLRWVETPVIAVWIIWLCFWLYSFWLPLMLAGKSYNSDSNSRGAHIPCVDIYLYTGIVRQPHFKLHVSWISLSHRYVIIAQGNKLLHARGGGEMPCMLICLQTPRNPSNFALAYALCHFPAAISFTFDADKRKEVGEERKERESGKRLEKVSSGRKTKRRTGGGNCFRTKAREVIWGEQTEGVVRRRRE